jgi:hypothetical protein
MNMQNLSPFIEVDDEYGHLVKESQYARGVRCPKHCTNNWDRGVENVRIWK